MANDWHQCVNWLVQCQMLPKQHRLCTDKAKVQDLANLLKDGVLICNLLNHLVPETLDPRDFSQRPQMSQFLCQKNINVFLQRCASVFRIDEKDLFEVADLATLQNFGKVLHTLSVLSQTTQALKSKVPSFLLTKSPSFSKIASDVESVEEQEDPEEEDPYMRPSEFEEDEKIYEFLVKTAKPKESQTKTRRDFCIEEIVETEKNYVEALEMINTKFMAPLRDCKDLLTPKDHERIFLGNEKLLSIHREFLEMLRKASTRDGQTTFTIPDCFVTAKEKFLFYGEFCSNLTNSQELLSRLCQNNPALLQKICECQRNANEGKFKLHDLLAIPMQRVLKYHLLINELMRNTDESHSERRSLERALEEMQVMITIGLQNNLSLLPKDDGVFIARQLYRKIYLTIKHSHDLSLFVNEVRRDHEMLSAISLLEKSITDLPVNIVLKDCGRILMDGEMKVKLASEGTAHSRHLFLFDRRLLICKQTKSDAYSYKTSLLLSSYKIDDTKDKMLIQLSEISGNSYQITAKNPEARNKWKNAILLAQENVSPPNAQNKKHDFQMSTFNRPTICDVCRKFLRGFIFQGYLCQKTSCRMAAHKECLEKAADMDGPPTPLPPRKEKCQAIKSYAGSPPPPGSGRTPLKFSIGDVIDAAVSISDPSWMEGELNGKRGFFPRSYVQSKPTRKGSSSDDPSAPSHRQGSTSGSDYMNLSASDDDIHSKPWYAGEMTRDGANDVLENLPQGAFVVRQSGDGKDHALSIQYEGPKHMKIGRTEKVVGDKTEKVYFLTAAKSFTSITELVIYHGRQSLEKLFPEVKTCLLYPYKDFTRRSLAKKDSATPNNKDSLGYCIAKYHYSATAPNHLTFRKGDRIAILNKGGDERGWWKGQLNGKSGYFPKSYVSE